MPTFRQEIEERRAARDFEFREMMTKADNNLSKADLLEVLLLIRRMLKSPRHKYLARYARRNSRMKN